IKSTVTTAAGHGTFNIVYLQAVGGVLSSGTVTTLEVLLFLAFALGFAIKVPMFPFHTWLPDAHVEAPTAGSVILAGLLLKLGTYRAVRFSLPRLPVARLHPVPCGVALSSIGRVYAALDTLVPQDCKNLIPYSS